MAPRIDPSDATRPNDPESIFKKHAEIVLHLKKRLDSASEERRSANSDYRNALKVAKKDGVDIDDFTAAIALLAFEPEEIERSFRNQTNYLLWLDKPVGTQFGMFSDTRAEDVVESSGEEVARPKPDPLKGRNAITADGAEAFKKQWPCDGGGYDEGSLAAGWHRTGWLDEEKRSLAQATAAAEEPAAGKRKRRAKATA